MDEILAYVKKALGITSDFQDEALKAFIKEVNNYLLDAGVDEKKINTEPTYGVVTRGVIDLWNYGASDGQLSPYFYERVIQLAAKEA